MAAFSIASQVQDWPISRQILATGLLFAVLCRTAGVNERDALVKLSSILLDTDPYHHRQIAALQQLIREEYLK
jgi:hypothetical protein